MYVLQISKIKETLLFTHCVFLPVLTTQIKPSCLSALGQLTVNQSINMSLLKSLNCCNCTCYWNVLSGLATETCNNHSVAETTSETDFLPLRR